MKLTELKSLFFKELPGEDAHLAFSPIRVKSSIAIQSIENYKEAAVAIVLFHDNQNELKSLVIERQTYDGNHSGQISFPGGKVDETDESLLHTAIRECKEEIGLELTPENLIREITPVYIPVSKFHVQPFVFYIDNLPLEFILSEREVYQLLSISMRDLCDDSMVINKDIQVGNTLLKNVPHFSLNNVEIWGATALMLNEIKAILKNSI